MPRIKILPDFTSRDLTTLSLSFFTPYKLLIFDLDNTLVYPETIKSTPEICAWFSSIAAHKTCLLVSNSPSRAARRFSLKKLFNCPVYQGKYKKPSKKIIKQICSQYQLKSAEILIVGDRLFTDVLLGKRTGAYTLLVDPLDAQAEKFYIRWVRNIENIILTVFK